MVAPRIIPRNMWQSCGFNFALQIHYRMKDKDPYVHTG